MSVRVEWGKLISDEMRTAIEPVLARWLHVVPPWCAQLDVYWHEQPNDDPTTVATMEARPSYRNATLTVGPLWLRESPESRDETIRHELAHLCTAQLDDVFARVLRQVKKANPALHADYAEQWRQAHEGTTCDIAAAYATRSDVPL